MARAVSAAKFHAKPSGAAAGRVGGIARLAPQAAIATATISAATVISPCPVAITMPAIVPNRIERNVPASTIALPSSSSSGASRSGRIAYLIGPKNAASTPMTNNSVSSNVALPAMTPAAAERDQQTRRHRARRVRAIGDHQHQRILQRIVVEGRQELRRKQRTEPPR